MKIVSNSKLIRRNAAIGKYTVLGAMGILALGLYITFKMPSQLLYSMGCLMLGFILSQVGTYYSNRWGRSPRPDELINKSLKGLGRDYTIYNYVTPAHHLLVGPAGVWVIMPYLQNGTVTYERKRWRIKGGGFVQSYLRVFGSESLGRPDLESESEVEMATRYLKRLLPEGVAVPDVKVALLFAHPQVELKVDESPLPAKTPADLRDYIKDKAKNEPIGELALDTIRKALPQPDKEEE